MYPHDLSPELIALDHVCGCGLGGREKHNWRNITRGTVANSVENLEHIIERNHNIDYHGYSNTHVQKLV